MTKSPRKRREILIVTYTSGKDAIEAQIRAQGYRTARERNIRLRTGPEGWRSFCYICTVDVGKVGVVLFPESSDDVVLCRDCAKRVGELVSGGGNVR